MQVSPGAVLVVTGPSGAGKTTVSRLVAGSFEPSAHVRIDDFTSSIVGGFVDPWLAHAAHQNEVVGGAVVAATMQFALGGYTVVLDGHLFPDVLPRLAAAYAASGVALHYAVLRAGLDTCSERAAARDPRTPIDPTNFGDLHRRFADLGRHEPNVIDTEATPAAVAAAVLAAYRSGRLAEPVDPTV